MQTRSKRFRPDRGLLFKVVYRDRGFKERMARTVIRNRVPPVAGELFSSWLARNAAINYLQTMTFVNCYFPEYKNGLLSRDVDIFIDEGIASNFARRMLLDSREIGATSLRSYGGRLIERVDPKTRNSLLSPVKIRGRYPRRKGLRYCPECMRKSDHFKKAWRLHFYAVCPEHGCLLLDECPDCGEPVFPIKRKRDVEAFNCWNCGFVYREAEARRLDGKSMAALYLESAMEILEKGYFQRGGRCHYSIAWFAVLKQLAKLIYAKGFRNSSLLEKECAMHGVELASPREIRRGPIEEAMSMVEAAAVYTSAFEILASPTALKRFVRDNGIRGSDLVRDMPYVPFWYAEATAEFSGKVYAPSYFEIEEAVKWMRARGMEIARSSVSRMVGVCLDFRKRPELRDLIC